MTESKFRAKELKVFLYWMIEREKIRRKKDNGDPWPWTKDPILRAYKFTNVYRYYDRTTRELVARMNRASFAKRKNPEDRKLLVFHICLFRLFNRAETYDAAIRYAGLISSFTSPQNYFDIVLATLKERQRAGKQIWSGAYVMHADAASLNRDKLTSYVDTAQAIWTDRDEALEMLNSNSLEAATDYLQKFNHIGPFVAYEMACDFGYFRTLLAKASDKLTWSNAGPGAKRGIHRLLSGSIERPYNGIDYVADMRRLLPIVKERFGSEFDEDFRPLELREIEHSLCEFDKYSRVYNDEGRSPKQKYQQPTT